VCKNFHSFETPVSLMLSTINLASEATLRIGTILDLDERQSIWSDLTAQDASSAEHAARRLRPLPPRVSG
jgi:hypothetical protein